MKKVVFVGDVCVGKTKLVSAVCGEKFDPEYRATVMDDRKAVFETRDSQGKHIHVKVNYVEIEAFKGPV